ncbi:MAG: hypothetical protein OEU46_16425 [Alphaproteobacteria bacterium]|nr:hypothetical protein [Alphaproteobacteria bacterium]
MRTGLVTTQEAEAVRHMHSVLDAYQEPGKDVYDYEGILADPAWIRVVSVVQAARTELAAILTDPGEIRVLFQNPLSDAC